MKSTGIIVEYNPFHNGHLHHIEEARRITDPDVLIACMSGDFNQRGDVSIVNKYEKCKAALKHGVDLVVELPYIFTVQDARVFGKRSVALLSSLGISDLVFGSETGNLEELKKFAELEIDVTRLKQLMHDGHSYPRSYGLLAGSLYPNDILAVSYLKALKDTSINPVCIPRIGDYKSEELGVIASATALRKAIREHRDVSEATPVEIDEPIFNEDLYPYLRRLLFTMDARELSDIFLVSEGIESLLKQNALEYSNYEDFMSASISRRYTRARIQRILLHLACHITKKDAEGIGDPDYVRVLGFNEKGRRFLSENKKKNRIVTLFKNIPEPYKNIEWKSGLLYASLLSDPDAYIRRLLQEPVIIE